MTTSLVVVIPVFNLTGARERNFWYVLKQIKRTNMNVLIVEQLRPNTSRVLKKKIEELHDRSVKHLSVIVDDNKIHKSRLINEGVLACGSTHVWVNDADCLLNFKHVVDNLDLKHDFIRPYSVGLNLTRSETEQLIRTARINVDRSIYRRQVKMYGALSFIFNKQSFIHIGMMNTKFTGWGREDLDLDTRVSSQHEIDVIEHEALHMWHEEPVANADNWNANTSDSKKPSAKIIHVINYLDPLTVECEHLSYRLWLADQSINQAVDQHEVLHLSCVTDPGTRVTRGIKQKLNRHDDSDRKLPYIKDMFSVALKSARPDDMILYTNADCVVSPDIYTNIKAANKQVIMYHRVDTHVAETVDEMLSQSGQVLVTGVDGFMISARVLKHVLTDLPDFLIGSPYWDLVLTEQLKPHNPGVNTTDLWHVRHDKSWSLREPDVSTKHNIQLANGLLPRYMFKHVNFPPPEHNKLCVMFLCCMQEVQSGAVESAISRFFSYSCSSEYKFDLHVCIDNISAPEQLSLKRKLNHITSDCENINQLNIYDAAIPEAENMFSYNPEKWREAKQHNKASLRLGSTNGINVQFFQSIRHLFYHPNAYENVLLLEADCDCINHKWYDRLIECCDTQDFLIMGSKYRGDDDDHTTRWYADHLNGVAIYKNNKQMLDMLTHAERAIEQYVHDITNQETWMNFDVALFQTAVDMHLTHKLVDTSIISNYSDHESSKMSVEQVLSRDINTVLLHKKSNESHVGQS